MREHRIIEGMATLMAKESAMIRNTNEVDTTLVDVMVVFLRTYADRSHHGKEEDILFRDLRKKWLSPEHDRILNDLIEEHAYARKIIGDMESANRRYAHGQADASGDVMQYLDNMIKFYQTHIQKEDKQFFFPAMQYFSKQELDDMSNEFQAFDRKIATEK